LEKEGVIWLVIRIENLSNDWAGFQLRNINLEVKENEYFVILGPTGAGKSLLLETIAGFNTPDDGKIFLKGKEITRLPPEKRKIGLVYQDYQLFPNKTVFENIAFGLRIKGLSLKEIEESVEEIATRLKIPHLLERYPTNLSGGESQRVSFGRALVLEPDLLLLDEPLSSLDLQMRNELITELKRLHEEFGTTFIHVTHNQQEALILGDRIGVMKEGSLIQVGSPEDIFRKPKSKFVANFVAVDNIFPGFAEKKDNLTRAKVKDLYMYSTEKKYGNVHITVRPEDIIVSKVSMESSARNVFNRRGAHSLYHKAIVH
jgi:molybdate/tungstate transport system ATP-binding protein